MRFTEGGGGEATGSSARKAGAEPAPASDAPLAGQSLFRGGFSDIQGRCAVASSKAAVKIREIIEADLVGNRAHLPLRGLRLAEHAMSAGEALADQKAGKRGAVDLKQSLQIALRHADMRRNAAD